MYLPVLPSENERIRQSVLIARSLRVLELSNAKTVLIHSSNIALALFLPSGVLTLPELRYHLDLLRFRYLLFQQSQRN